MSHHLFPWYAAFLAALREKPVVQHACDAVGIERSTAYRARQADKAFADAWADAMEAGVDRAESEAFRRGVEGYEEPVVDKGRLAYRYERYLDDDGGEHWRILLGADGQPVPLTIRKHSDQLLAKVLSARRAAYRTERTELTGADGGPMQMDATTRAARVVALTELARRRREAEDFG
jgi:hypothetical protein